jgi:hypothetical protein
LPCRWLYYRVLNSVVFRHNRVLNSIKVMEQFHSYVLRVQHKEFLWYQKASPITTLEFQSVVNKLHLNLKGIRFLDIGPGYGDSLDICYENGAECIEFVEIDPFFFTYNRLKGYTRGYRIDLITGLGKLEGGKYDFIWIKGSIQADFFITTNQLKIEPLSLSHWLSQLERLASPTCQIIICPHWANDTHKRNIEDVQRNDFTDTMLKGGYVILPKIENHNQEPQYPITFYNRQAP